MNRPQHAGRGSLTFGWLGIALLLLGTLIAYRWAAPDGQDFRAYYYPMSARFLHKQNPYILSGDPLRVDEAARGKIPLIVIAANAYPPITAVVLSPLALLPEPVARQLWLTLSLGVMFLGVWCAMRVIGPQWSINTRLLLLGLVACAGSLRWCAVQYQAALAVTGLLGLFLYAELSGRDRLALLCALLITIKPTLIAPVLVLWIFRQRYRQLALLVVLTVAINVLVMARTGLAETYAGWRINMANYAAPGSNNYPDTNQNVKFWRGEHYDIQMQPGVAPIPDFSYTGDFTHWVFLFTAYTSNFGLASRLGALCSLLAVVGLTVLWYRQRPAPDDHEFMLRLFAVAVTLSLLISSHIRYDSILLVYAFLVGVHLMRFKAVKADAVVLITCCVLVAFVAISKITFLITKITLAIHVRWLIPVYAYGVTLAFLVAFRSAWLHHRHQERLTPSPPS